MNSIRGNSASSDFFSPPPAKVAKADDIQSLVAELKQEHAARLEAAQRTLACARRSGQILLKLKKQIGRGCWGDWLYATVKTLGFSERTAQQYMALAEHWDELPAESVADLTITEALKLLQKPKAQDTALLTPSAPPTAAPEPGSAEPGERMPNKGDAAEPEPYEVGPDFVRIAGRLFRTPNWVDKLCDAIDQGDADAWAEVVVKLQGNTLAFALCGTDNRDIVGPDWEMFLESVRIHGIKNAVLVDKADQVIDGRERLRAAAELKLPLDQVPTEVVDGTIVEKYWTWYAYNVSRKHETTPQQLELMVESLEKWQKEAA